MWCGENTSIADQSASHQRELGTHEMSLQHCPRIWGVTAFGQPGGLLESRCWQSEKTWKDHLKFSFYQPGKWSLKDTLSFIQSHIPLSHPDRRPESPLWKPSVLCIALECLELTYLTQWQQKTLFTDESNSVLDFGSYLQLTKANTVNFSTNVIWKHP